MAKKNRKKELAHDELVSQTLLLGEILWKHRISVFISLSIFFIAGSGVFFWQKHQIKNNMIAADVLYQTNDIEGMESFVKNYAHTDLLFWGKKHLAEIYIKENQYEEAKNILQELVLVAKENFIYPYLLISLADCYEELGEYEKIEQLFEEPLSQMDQSYYPMLLNYYIDVLIRQQKIDKAQNYLEILKGLEYSLWSHEAHKKLDSNFLNNSVSH